MHNLLRTETRKAKDSTLSQAGVGAGQLDDQLEDRSWEQVVEKRGNKTPENLATERQNGPV